MESPDLLRDVAARIIQHYWRTRPGRRAPLPQQPPPAAAPPAAQQDKLQQEPGGTGGARTLDSRATERLRQCCAGRGVAKPPRPPLPGPSSARPTTSPSPASDPQPTGGGAVARVRPGTASAARALPPRPPPVQQRQSRAKKVLQLEDSAERVSHSAQAGTTAVVGAAELPLPSPRPGEHNVVASPSRVAAAAAAAAVAPAAPPCLVSNTPELTALKREAATTAPQLAAPLSRSDPLRTSAASEKMSHILDFLDQLEAQAGQEEAAVLLGPHPLARAMAARPASLHAQQLAAEAVGGGADAGCALAAAGASRLVARCSEVLEGVRSSSSTQPAGAQVPADDCGGRGASQQRGDLGLAAVDAGILNTAAVADSVKAKIQRLQQQVQAGERRVAELAATAQQAQQAHEQALAAALRQHQAQLAQQRSEHEATVGRNLAFIDRILADKDALSAKCGQLGQELAGMQAECARQIEALKEGLAKELRKQKEGWLAAERAKREAWAAEQARAIKESTIRGLEPEIQRLVEVHKAELKRAEHRHDAECSRRLAAAAAAHEQHVAQLRQGWAAEKAAALEAEKAAGREQIKDAQQRFEVELQNLRMRLAAEHQVQLDRAETARREDRTRAEERVAQAAREHEQRLAAVRGEAADERAAAARQHARELEALKEKYETGQEAWRAAVAERAKQEVEAREAALRRQLAAERDAELRAVIGRLEAEFLAKEEALQAELGEKEAAVEARWADEVSRLRASEAALREQAAAAEARVAGGEERAGRLEELVHTLQREMASKASSTAWLEEQLAAAKREAVAKEEQKREALAEQGAAAAQEREALGRQLEELRGQLAAARAEAEAVCQRKAEELEALEARVRGALAKKDEQVAALREQLTLISRQLAEEEV